MASACVRIARARTFFFIWLINSFYLSHPLQFITSTVMGLSHSKLAQRLISPWHLIPSVFSPTSLCFGRQVRFLNVRVPSTKAELVSLSSLFLFKHQINPLLRFLRQTNLPTFQHAVRYSTRRSLFWHYARTSRSNRDV